MAAKFYAAYGLSADRDIAMEIAAEGMANFYHEISSDFGWPFFFACMHLWKSGPAMTYARLKPNMAPKYFCYNSTVFNAFKNLFHHKFKLECSIC